MSKIIAILLIVFYAVISICACIMKDKINNEIKFYKDITPVKAKERLEQNENNKTTH